MCLAESTSFHAPLVNLTQFLTASLCVLVAIHLQLESRQGDVVRAEAITRSERDQVAALREELRLRDAQLAEVRPAIGLWLIQALIPRRIVSSMCLFLQSRKAAEKLAAQSQLLQAQVASSVRDRQEMERKFEVSNEADACGCRLCSSPSVWCHLLGLGRAAHDGVARAAD